MPTSPSNSEEHPARQPNLPLTWQNEDYEPQDETAAHPDHVESPSTADEPPAAAEPAERVDAQPDSDEEALRAPETEAGREDEESSVPGEPADHDDSVETVRFEDLELGLGQTLMEARGARNLTIEQVSQRTVVPKEFIQNMEAERFDQLPPMLYARSYLRKLCGEYDLDAGPLVRELLTHKAEQHAQQEEQRFYVTPEQADDGTTKLRYRMHGANAPGSAGHGLNPLAVVVAAAVGFLLLLVLSAITVQHIRNKPSAAPEPAVESSADAEAASTAGSTEAVDWEQFMIPQLLPLKELPIPDA